MSVDPCNQPTIIPSSYHNFWAPILPEMSYVDASSVSAKDYIKADSAEGKRGRPANNPMHMLCYNQLPSESQLFGVPGVPYYPFPYPPTSKYIIPSNRVYCPTAQPISNPACTDTDDDSLSQLPRSNAFSSQRMQHYHHRHHAHAQKQGNSVKNKARFSATGMSYNYMVVRDSKMSLSSAPPSPNAGSVGGSLGHTFIVTPVPVTNSAYTVHQCKGSSSSSSSGYSSTNSSKISSQSSYSSCSSLSSTPSVNGISPRKRPADDTSNIHTDCRKEYYQKQGQCDVINLCSCETCATDDVTARVDDVTLIDTDEHGQQHKRSKNDDDVVFVSAEPATCHPLTHANAAKAYQIWSPHNESHLVTKERTLRKTRKANKKPVARCSPAPTASGSESFPFAVPSSMVISAQVQQQQEQVGRYFLRSAAKGRKQEDTETHSEQQPNSGCLTTQVPKPAAFMNNGKEAPLSPQRLVQLQGLMPLEKQPEGDRSTTSPRYHTRSYQKKVNPQMKPPNVTEPNSAHHTPSTHSVQHQANHAPLTSSTCHPASVIQSPVTCQKPHVSPASCKEERRVAFAPYKQQQAGTTNQCKQERHVKFAPNEQDVSSTSSPKVAPEPQRSFRKLYDIHGLIGVGGGGSVYAGTRKSDGAQVAVKQVPKAKVKRWGKLNDRVVPIEFELLYRASRTGHKGIIGMLDWFERRSAYILVMERPQPVMDLFDYLNQHGAVPERIARLILHQIAEAVIHCHANGVIHRDIKDENVILNLHTSEAKLIDFGCGTVLKDAPYTEFAGTPEFYPPEWFTHRRYFGQRVDCWSLGVLLYTMVEAEVPFQGEKEIVECKLRHKRQLSDSCKHLIAWMLQKDQEKRPTVSQVLQHPWFQATNSNPTSSYNSGVMGTDELYEKRLQRHQNRQNAGASTTHHKIASTESPESPPRYNGNCHPQGQKNRGAVFQTDCRA